MEAQTRDLHLAEVARYEAGEVSFCMDCGVEIALQVSDLCDPCDDVNEVEVLAERQGR